MKLHVLTTITSASDGWGVSSWPWDVSWPIMTSVSTRFLGHPRLTNPIFKASVLSVLNVAVGEAAFFEILLMIFFRAPEFGGGNDLGDDRPGKTCLRGFPGSPGFHQLFGRVVKNRRAILSADIGTLAIQGRRVVIVPEYFEQVVVADHLRIEGDFDGFRVAGPVGADVFVSGIFQRAAHVAHLRRFHTCEAAERS